MKLFPSAKSFLSIFLLLKGRPTPSSIYQKFLERSTCFKCQIQTQKHLANQPYKTSPILCFKNFRTISLHTHSPLLYYRSFVQGLSDLPFFSAQLCLDKLFQPHVKGQNKPRLTKLVSSFFFGKGALHYRVCHLFILTKRDDYFRSILTTFEMNSISGGSRGNIENQLEPKTKLPLENLACPNP